MPRPFSPATAEQAAGAIEAVVVNGQPTRVEFVAEFLDLNPDQAEAALKLATDIGLLSYANGRYSAASPLCRFFVTPNQMQKATFLRLVLESYPPFLTFRERLVATTLASIAAQQTKVALDLDAHREAIKDTLISLGTYSHALITEGGGHYRPAEAPAENLLRTVAEACTDAASAEARIREELGTATAFASREEVIVPLSDSLLRASGNDPRGAVVSAGNAVESYLTAFAARATVNISGAHGINAKLDRFAQVGRLPSKLASVGKYLGHIRNAADHGTDPEVNATWTIRSDTGVQYVHVACSFLASLAAAESGRGPEI